MSEIAVIAIGLVVVALIAAVGLGAGIFFALRLRRVLREQNAMIENAFARNARTMLDLGAGQGLIRSDAKALKRAVKKNIDQSLLVQAELHLANNHITSLVQSLQELQIAQTDHFERFERLEQRVQVIALTARAARAGIEAVEDLAASAFEDISVRAKQSEATLAEIAATLERQREQDRRTANSHRASIKRVSETLSRQGRDSRKTDKKQEDAITRLSESLLQQDMQLSKIAEEHEAAIMRVSETLAGQHRESRESLRSQGVALTKLSGDLSDQCEELRTANDALSAALSRVAKSQSEEFGEIGSRFKSVEKRIADRRMLEGLLDQESHRTAELSDRLHALKTANDETREQLVLAEQARATAEQHAGKANSDTVHLQIDIDSLKAKLKSIERQSDRLSQEVESREAWRTLLATEYIQLIKSAKGESWGGTLAQALLCRKEAQRSRLETVLKEKPDEPLVQYAMARHLIEDGVYDAALPHLRNAIRTGLLGPTSGCHIYAWLTMSTDLMIEAARPDLAIEALKEWMESEEAEIAFRVKAGLKAAKIMEQTGRQAEALESLATLVSAAPHQSTLKHMQAAFLFRYGRHEEAVAVFELLHSNGSNPQPDHVRALFALGREDEAAKLARAIADAPHDVKAIADRPKLTLRLPKLTKIARAKRSLDERFEIAETFRRVRRPVRDIVRAYSDLNKEDDAYRRLGLIEDSAAVPSLFLFGPPRSGTTLLRRSLGLNAAMNVRPSEPEFLSNNRFMPLAAYLAPFQEQITKAHQPGICLSAEKSPQMFALEANWAKVFTAMFPESRLILTVRDPVARAWSFVKHLGRENMSRALVDTEASKFPIWMERTIDEGRYERHLQKWISALGPDRIFLMDFETLTQDLPGAVAAVCDWLDCPQNYAREDVASLAEKWDNRTPREPVPEHLEGFLRACYVDLDSNPVSLRKRFGVGGI